MEKRGVDELTATTEIIQLVSTETEKDSVAQKFFVNRDVVEVSKHLKKTLASEFQEGQSKVVKLGIPAHVLEIAIKYMHYKVIN